MQMNTLAGNGPNIVLPEDIQQAVERAQNEVTLRQADIDRLARLKMATENEIGRLNTRCYDIEAQINAKNIELDGLKVKVTNQVAQSASLDNEIVIKRTEKTNLETAINQFGQEFNTLQLKLNSIREEIKQTELKTEEEKKRLNELDKLLATKHQQIKEFAASL
jgi:chromosome segregation ATPase